MQSWASFLSRWIFTWKIWFVKLFNEKKASLKYCRRCETRKSSVLALTSIQTDKQKEKEISNGCTCHSILGDVRCTKRKKKNQFVWQHQIMTTITSSRFRICDKLEHGKVYPSKKKNFDEITDVFLIAWNTISKCMPMRND